MTPLSSEEFGEFLAAVTGYRPFVWQQELVNRLLADDIPEVIDVPTGFGKTSLIHCWAYALASQIESGQPRLPLRLFVVVDRRLIVDATYHEAEALAKALAAPNEATHPAVGRVAAALRSLHGSSEPPVEVVRMRGGATWEARWLRRPDQAAVVAGTVDQFGSRLLFRGFGVSEAMRPLNAALVGIDSWLVIDEAHIAAPLVKTAKSVIRHQKDREANCGIRPLRLTLMSATAEQDPAVSRLQADLEVERAASENARRRLSAVKAAALVDLGFLEKPIKGRWRTQAEDLGRALARLAMTVDDTAQVVGIVANTIATAREAHRFLEQDGASAMLLIGRVREYERSVLLEKWLPQIRVGGVRPEHRLYVVATQTIEVGANIDLDALVTECAPLAALIQRFGRVNRVGALASQRSLIVHAGFSHDNDPVYGMATKETWDYFSQKAQPETIAKEAGLDRISSGVPTVAFGISAVRELVDSAPKGVQVEPTFVPTALGAHFERWAATSPAPMPDQDVGPFLHGVDRTVPEVSVAWRAMPPVEAPGLEAWGRWLDLVPPVEWEFVTVPIWELRAFLDETTSEHAMADLDGARSDGGTRNGGAGEADSAESRELGDEIEAEQSRPAREGVKPVPGVVYLGAGEVPRAVRTKGDVRPGDRVVLHCTLGGHDTWGWTGKRRGHDAPLVPDVADLAPSRRRSVIRLARRVLETLVSPEQHAQLGEALGRLDRDELAATVPEVMKALAELMPGPFANLVDKPDSWNPVATGFTDEDEPVALLFKEAESREVGDAFADDSESTTSQTGRADPLPAHGRDVASTAALFAAHVGLPAELGHAVRLGANYHDLGKGDPRFQVMLHDGDELAALAASEPLAKSGRHARDPLARAARGLAQLPPGFRHEAVSARLFDDLAQKAPALLAGLDADLVRHLVVSHHGKARPLLPPLLDPHAPTVRLRIYGVELEVEGAQYQVDWAQPERFESLGDRYGWWGLAYLEAIVRLADILCSSRLPHQLQAGSERSGEA